jgi:hypothetical protein
MAIDLDTGHYQGKKVVGLELRRRRSYLIEK